MRKSLLAASALTLLCIVLSMATLLTSSCSSLARNLNIVNPTYSIRDIRPRVDIALPLSQSSIDFDFLLGINNQNSVGLRLDRVDFNLLINDSHIIDGYSDSQIKIPARGVGDVHLRARVGYDSLRSLFREVADMVQGNRARYELRGTAYYDTPVGQLRFPLTVYRSGNDRR
jgi:LEA14-like dessication related protein